MNTKIHTNTRTCRHIIAKLLEPKRREREREKLLKSLREGSPGGTAV